jgi:hypothetical protein
MANDEHLAVLRQGVDAWNTWRERNPGLTPDFIRAVLPGADLSNADLSGALLPRANLSKANLGGANLDHATLLGTNLSQASLREANFSLADLSLADLTYADLARANLTHANLSGAKLRAASLYGVNLHAADLSGADLSGADINVARLTDVNFTGAVLTGCRVYGISAWDLELARAEQRNLIITPHGVAEITVDNLEVAQFIYLLLNNERIRHVIDTITSKVVLIIGRFTEERKVVLDALREELRQRDYLPVLFDFDKPASKDLTGTVQTLANMARFVIADLTDPSSVPHELAIVVPTTPVPVQPVLLEGQREYAMFVDLKRRYHWVLEPYRYASRERLLADLGERVIAPAEAKALELRGVSPPTA